MNRSLVLLGYIFYEENALSKAVSALRMVPPRAITILMHFWGLDGLQLKPVSGMIVSQRQALAQASGKFIMQCEGALLRLMVLYCRKSMIRLIFCSGRC